MYDKDGLEPFSVVLRKKLDSYLMDAAQEEINLTINSNIVVPSSKSRKGPIKYFSKPPSPGASNCARIRKKWPNSVPYVETNSSGTVNAIHHDFDDENLVQHICKVCGVSVDTKAILKRHMITHTTGSEPCKTKDNSIYLNLCNHKLSNPISFTTNVIIIIGPVCGQLFKRKDDMNKHFQRIHERNYRFQCSMCPKKFIDASGNYYNICQ